MFFGGHGVLLSSELAKAHFRQSHVP